MNKWQCDTPAIDDVNGTRQHDLANGYVAVAYEVISPAGYDAGFATTYVIEGLLIDREKLTRHSYNVALQYE